MLRLLTNSGPKIIRCDDYYIRELANGLDECIFTIDVWDPLYPELVEEAQIQDADGKTYLIKQIDGGANTAKIIARIDLDAWEAEMHLAYGNGIKTVYQTVDAVKPSGWSVIDQSGSTIRRTVNGNLTALEICQECEDIFFVWFRWDNAAMTCTIISKTPPASIGSFATRDLNLKQINYKGKSNDFRTRIYAYGQDGMTFASINGGKPYLDDNRYSSKILPMYWKDERYTIPENLMHDAAEKLAEVAVPKRSYDCAVVDLKAVDPAKYGFLDFSLFTTATLIDDIKNFAVDYQVVERHIYPYYPEKNDVIFDSSPQKLTAIVDNTKDLLEARPTSEEVQIDVDRATGVLQTGKSGFVVIGRNADGYANEIYFLDTNNMDTARQVLRINKAGIGFSSTGVSGPYYQSWTLDGHFSLGGVNNAYGDFEILDSSGNKLGEWDKDGLKFYDSAQHILMLLNHSGLYLKDTNNNTLAELTAAGLNIYKGTISGVTINIARGNDVGLYCDGTVFRFGDFEVNTDYGRQILESMDEMTGMGGEPDQSGGLYLWAGYNNDNDYRLAVNDAGIYTVYNGTTYNIGQTLEHILAYCCGGGCSCDNSDSCSGDGCGCYGSTDSGGDGCCSCYGGDLDPCQTYSCSGDSCGSSDSVTPCSGCDYVE